jgi:hypothetical protein
VLSKITTRAVLSRKACHTHFALRFPLEQVHFWTPAIHRNYKYPAFHHEYKYLPSCLPSANSLLQHNSSSDNHSFFPLHYSKNFTLTTDPSLRTFNTSEELPSPHCATMSPLLFLILLLLSPFTLSASFRTSASVARYITSSPAFYADSLPLDNTTLVYRDDKPNPKTDGRLCTRNAACAMSKYFFMCGNPPNLSIAGCSRETPSSAHCCGKDLPKDHVCNRFWPESNAKCQDQMKNFDCHRFIRKTPICERINTEETPDQCALKTQCAANAWQKKCGKWHQQLFKSGCHSFKPEYQACCLPKYRLQPTSEDFKLPGPCKDFWPKDVTKCAKGCKAGIGGKVTCPKKRDIMNPEPSANTSAPVASSEPVADPAMSSESFWGNSSLQLATMDFSDDMLKGEITTSKICGYAAQCAHVVWQEQCNSGRFSKVKPWCWNRAP